MRHLVATEETAEDWAPYVAPAVPPTYLDLLHQVVGTRRWQGLAVFLVETCARGSHGAKGGSLHCRHQKCFT
jgi:hypothetical protein